MATSDLEDSVNEPEAHAIIDVTLGENQAPPVDATPCANGIYADASGLLFAPIRKGWLTIERAGKRHWRISRPNSDSLDIDRALFKTIGLDADIVPLHASIAQFNGEGIAAIGRAASGKTAVLLNLIASGANWLTDDEADYCLTTHSAVAFSAPIAAKWRYLRELPRLRRRVPLHSRLRMHLYRLIRFAAKYMKHGPFNHQTRQKLRRVGDGDSRVSIEFPGKIKSSSLRSIIFVVPGAQSELREVDCDDVCQSITATLWSELEPVHMLDKAMAEASQPHLFDRMPSTRQKLQVATRKLLEDNDLFVLTRPPRMTMRELTALLRPVIERSSSTH